MGTPSMARASRVGQAASGAATREFDFLSCEFGKTQELLVSDGIRGTRSYFDNQAADGVLTVGGNLVLEPRPDDLDVLLPLILGGEEESDSFPLAETLPESDWTVDKVAQVYRYTACKVNTARLTGSTGQKLQLALDLQGKTEVEEASFPAIEATLSVKRPYIFYQGVLTLTTPREFSSFDFLVDNALILDRHMNSQSRTALPESNRIITLTVQNPFTADELDLYNLGIAGIAGSLVFTNGPDTLTLSMTNLKRPKRPIGIPSKNVEITQPLEFRLFATQAGATITRELEVTSTNTVA